MKPQDIIYNDWRKNEKITLVSQLEVEYKQYLWMAMAIYFQIEILGLPKFAQAHKGIWMFTVAIWSIA